MNLKEIRSVAFVAEELRIICVFLFSYEIGRHFVGVMNYGSLVSDKKNVFSFYIRF